MAYKDLLVVVDDNPHARERVRIAADLLVMGAYGHSRVRT